MWNNNNDNNFGFQFDFLSWEMSKLYRPKIILLLIALATIMSFCDRPSAEKRAQMLVVGARGANDAWQLKYTLSDLNEAVKLGPKLPETYAARGNLYASWSKFLKEAETNETKREKAEAYGFDLKAANKYKKQALKDYQKSLKLIEDEEHEKLEKEVLDAMDCLEKESVRFCSAYITLSELK